MCGNEEMAMAHMESQRELSDRIEKLTLENERLRKVVNRNKKDQAVTIGPCLLASGIGSDLVLVAIPASTPDEIRNFLVDHMGMIEDLMSEEKLAQFKKAFPSSGCIYQCALKLTPSLDACCGECDAPCWEITDMGDIAKIEIPIYRNISVSTYDYIPNIWKTPKGRFA